MTVQDETLSILEPQYLITKHQEGTFYKGEIKNIPNIDEFQLEQRVFHDLESKIRLLSYLAVYNNFDESECNKGWYSSVINKPEKKHKVEFTNALLYLFELLSNLKVWHYVNGSTRVGRDDVEWDEYTYVLPILTQQRLPDILLDEIQKEMGIDFKFEDNNSRYYCFVRGESDTIPGCWRREGGYSESLRRTVFIRILLIVFKLIEEKRLFI